MPRKPVLARGDPVGRTVRPRITSGRTLVRVEPKVLPFIRSDLTEFRDLFRSRILVIGAEGPSSGARVRHWSTMFLRNREVLGGVPVTTRRRQSTAASSPDLQARAPTGGARSKQMTPTLPFELERDAGSPSCAADVADQALVRHARPGPRAVAAASSGDRRPGPRKYRFSDRSRRSGFRRARTISFVARSCRLCGSRPRRRVAHRPSDGQVCLDLVAVRAVDRHRPVSLKESLIDLMKSRAPVGLQRHTTLSRGTLQAGRRRWPPPTGYRRGASRVCKSGTVTPPCQRQSPYLPAALRQPVDWWPWSTEAFARRSSATYPY